MKEAKQMVEESDIKYDEVARKLAMVSVPLISINPILLRSFQSKSTLHRNLFLTIGWNW